LKLENWPFAKRKLKHQEESVRNRHRRSFICIFVLASALSVLAQSGRVNAQRGDGLQLVGAPGQPVLIATAVGTPAISSLDNESELPDAPSAAKPDTTTADPSAAPAKKESNGAPAAATGGSLGVDRTVADRNYLAVTGGMFGASIINAELTVHCLNVHPSCNDVPTSLHSRAALYGIGIPADIGVAYLTYIMKKKHSHIWYVPAALVTGANLFFGVRAYRWSQD
jgi:hypothetical protein